MKSVQIWSFFLSVSSRIWTEYGISIFSPNERKEGPEKNSVFGLYSLSEKIVLLVSIIGYYWVLKCYYIKYYWYHTLGIEIFNFLNGLYSPIINEVFQVQPSAPNSLRHNDIYCRHLKTLTYWTESISFLAPKTWLINCTSRNKKL